MMKKFLAFLTLALAITANAATPQSGSTTNSAPAVKMSSTGICHEKGSKYYNQAKHFMPFDSLDECLQSGGKLSKKSDTKKSAATKK